MLLLASIKSLSVQERTGGERITSRLPGSRERRMLKDHARL